MIWLKIEGKRAARRLPFLTAEAVILALTAGMLAFCAFWIKGEEEPEQKIIIALSAENGDELTELAIAYVENMESFRELCSFVRVPEAEGRRLVEEGKAAALLVLPGQVVEGILSGNNVPAALYVPGDRPVTSLLFGELAEAGVSMLRTAQAQIYAALQLQQEYGIQKPLEDIYREVNRHNLELAMNREQLFRTRNVSATGEQSLAAYYMASFAALSVLLMGLALGDYSYSGTANRRLLQRAGISEGGQLGGEWLTISLFLGAGSLIAGAVLAGVLFVAGLAGARDGTVSQLLGMLTGQAAGFHMGLKEIAGLLCVYLCGGAMVQLMYKGIRSKGAALPAMGIVFLGMGTVSGCFIPSLLLPAGVQKAAAWLPLTYMKAAWNQVLSGGGTMGGITLVQGADPVLYLLGFTMLFLSISLWLEHRLGQFYVGREGRR